MTARTAFDNMKPDHPMYEALKRELIQSAMHEISDLVKEYRLYLDEYVQTTRVARVASMVPTVGQWLAIVRQQNALERLLERKIRLRMDLQEDRVMYGAPPPGLEPRPTPARDPALSRGERVARDGAFTSRRGSGEGSPTESAALSRGERVARDGAFSSRRGSGEGSLHCHTHPPQNTKNSRNELNDLLQTHNLASNVYTKRTVSEAPNELLVGVHESVGPARPIHEPTPHPSCSGWRKRRSPTPSPRGRGLLRRVGERPLTASVAPIPPLRDRHVGLKPGGPSAAGRVRGHFLAAPTQRKTQKIVGTNSTIYCSQMV